MKWKKIFINQPLSRSYWQIQTEYGKNTPAAQVLKEKDANLIAAAPDLLLSCKEALEYYKQRGVRFSVVVAKLNKLVAKAEGK